MTQTKTIRETAEARQALSASDLERQIRYHHAMARCATALQDFQDESAVETALAALLEASDADYVYVDQNYNDPLQGPSVRVVHDVEKPNRSPVDAVEEWWAGPWSQLPTTHAALSVGETLLVRTADLEGKERELYENDGVKSELCIPIQVAGEWWGSVAFADYHVARNWSGLEKQILETAARMLGSFIERRRGSEEMGALLLYQQKRLRYEKAIAECSTALLMSSDDSAIDIALREVMEVTGVHNVYVDRNVEDPDLGLAAVAVHEVIRSGYEGIALSEFWDYDTDQPQRPLIAYSAIPTVRESLEKGEIILVIPSELPPAERPVYESTGCLSELNIPIMASESWLGSIVFVDYLEERRWDDEDDLSLLQTVAEMIGAYWERSAAQNRLEELLRSKDEFVAAVSHEIRTPLTSVVGLSNELREHGKDFNDGETHELISVIADQSNEVADIVSDLLVAARADSGALSVSPRSVAIHDLVDEMMRTRLFDSFHHVEVDGPDLAVYADPGRLRQVLRNLVVNAKRYGGDNLRIDVSRVDDDAQITVADDGQGVSEGDAEHIFEAYRRAHNDSNQPASIGLGLAVARQLTRLMNGEIEYSRTGGWTEFTVTIPTDSHESN